MPWICLNQIQGPAFLALLTGITGKAKAAASSYRFPWQSTEVYSSSHFLKAVFLLMGVTCSELGLTYLLKEVEVQNKPRAGVIGDISGKE